MEKSKEAAEPGRLRQWISALIINLPALSYGMAVGWPSPMGPLLKSDKSPLNNDPITDDAMSLLTGILCLAGFIATPIFGPLSEKFGRKITGYVVVLPLILAWLLKIFASSQSYLFWARIFCGIGGAGAIFIGPFYTSEIACPSLRGTLSSLMAFALNFGILLSFVFGAFLPYLVFNGICLSVPLVFLATFGFLPETPIYLVRRQHLNDATRSLIWFRGDSKFAAERELLALQDEAKEAESNDVGAFSDLLTDPATRRGMIISVGLMLGQQLSGIFIVVSNSTEIFKMAGSSLSPYAASIIIGAIQVLGSYLSVALMEKAGRRFLILVSTSGTCVCLAAISGYCYLQNLGHDVDAFSWIPVFFLSIYMVVYCLGIGPGPFVVSSEIFRRDISGLANTVSLMFLWFMAFLVIMSYNTMLTFLSMHGCFLAFSCFCAGTFLFTLVFLPETKGRTLDSIVAELAGGEAFGEKKTWRLNGNPGINAA